MKDKRSRNLSRRELFRAAARGAAVATLGVVAVLLRTPDGKPPAEAPCVNGFICGGCPTLGACGLPQAMSARQAMRKGES